MASEIPIWLNEKGVVNEVVFCNMFVEQMPLKYIKGRFYGLDGLISDDIISRDICIMLTEYVSTNISRKVNSLLEALKLKCLSEPLEPNPNEIHLQNGFINIDGQFTPEKRFCISRMNVTYDPLTNAPPSPSRFIQFLKELLYPEDIPTLQEFLGYCLIPSTKGQAMMFLIGNGEEGKSRIGKIMSAIWGSAMLEGKFQRIETDRFFRYNLMDKLVMVDDDMQLNALSSTGYIKSLATAEIPIDIEAKGRQSEQAHVYTRILGFGNGSPKALYDKSEGFARRLLILSVRPKPPDRVNDPYLADKLLCEKNEIFRWLLEGVQRLVMNRFKFTVSERTKKNVSDALSDSCNIIDFLQDDQIVAFGSDLQTSCTELYAGYCFWCRRNGMTEMKRDSFIGWLKNNESRFNIKYDFHITNKDGGRVRGFKGIKTKYVAYVE